MKTDVEMFTDHVVSSLLEFFKGYVEFTFLEIYKDLYLDL